MKISGTTCFSLPFSLYSSIVTQFLVTEWYIFASTRTCPHSTHRKDSAPGIVLGDTAKETVIFSLSWKCNPSFIS